MGPAAAAQVGVDAMNVALNPGSSATSALGAVGCEGEVQEVAGVLVDSIQSAITNAISPFLRQQQAAIEAVASGMTETKRKIGKQAPASERHSEKLKKQRTELVWDGLGWFGMVWVSVSKLAFPSLVLKDTRIKSFPMYFIKQQPEPGSYTDHTLSIHSSTRKAPPPPWRRARGTSSRARAWRGGR